MKRIYALLIILLVVELITASTCAPHSCEWGNSTYFYTGLLLAAIAFILPLLQKSWSVQKRVAVGLLFLLGSILVWIIGFILFDFSIMCRLF